MSRIRIALRTLFGLHIDISTIYSFKKTISFHYLHSYDEILKTLLSSPVLYADETVANLRSESGYVWCITDGRSVYYFYKASREGSFLPEMLKDFRGVLVSDFFTAYDSVPCRQQRCLVHLMRDFNEEIKNHPFDDELKLLAAEFSAVVKSVVETIDTYGFKKRHLRKHKKMAGEFCRRASDKECGSPPAERVASGRAIAERTGVDARTAVIDPAHAVEVDQAVAVLGGALATLVNALDPDRLIVGGGLGRSQPFFDRLVEATRAGIEYPDTRELPIVQSALGADGGVVGAALAVARRYGAPDVDRDRPVG